MGAGSSIGALPSAADVPNFLRGVAPADVQSLVATLREREELASALQEHASTAGGSALWEDSTFHGDGALGPEVAERLMAKSPPTTPLGMGGGGQSVDWIWTSELLGSGEEPPVLFPKDRTPVASDVLEGNIGDCFLIAALSVIANSSTDQTLITRLFLGDTLEAGGPVGVQLFHDGRWTTVVVDQRLAARPLAMHGVEDVEGLTKPGLRMSWD